VNIETTLEDLNELIEFAKGHEWDLPITAAEDLEWACKCIKGLQSEADRWKKQYIQTNAEMNRLFNALITTRERLNRVLKVLSNIDWGDEGNAEATVKEITMQLATEYDTEEQE
jgi:hypothetical protein